MALGFAAWRSLLLSVVMYTKWSDDDEGENKTTANIRHTCIRSPYLSLVHGLGINLLLLFSFFFYLDEMRMDFFFGIVGAFLICRLHCLQSHNIWLLLIWFDFFFVGNLFSDLSEHCCLNSLLVEIGVEWMFEISFVTDSRPPPSFLTPLSLVHA